MAVNRAEFDVRAIAVISLLVDNKDAIAELCRQYGIKKLDVFGSAATGAFDPATSDVDFIIDLGEYSRDVAWRYLDLCDALEELLGYPVEVISDCAIKNPYLREAVEEQREKLYDASDSQAVA